MSQYTASIQALYVAYFNRPADPGGLAYWETIVAASNGNTAAVSANFAKSAEYKAAYAGLGADATINQVYLNIFGRTVDRDGLNFWSPKLASGAVTIDQIVTEVAKGAQLSDKVTYENRTTASVAYTDALNADVSLRLAYSNAAAIVSAKSFLNGITTTDSLTAAIAPASLAANLAKMVVDSAPAPVVTTFTLTTGLDTLTGTSGNDVFNAVDTTITGLDVINGGAGNDTLNVSDVTGANANLALLSVSNVETFVLTSSAGLKSAAANVSGWTGLTSANFALKAGAAAQTITAATTTALTVADATATGGLTIVGGGGVVTVTEGAGAILIGQATAPTAADANAITSAVVKGGTTVAVTDNSGTAGVVGSKLTTVSVDGNTGAATFTGKVITNVTVANGAATSDVTIVNATAAHTQNLTVNNNATGLVITDATATTVNITATGVKSAVALAVAAATTINAGGSIGLTLDAPGADYTALTTVNITGSGGVTADLSTATTVSAALITAINASTSTGTNTVTVTATQESYTGGSGVDKVTIGAVATKVIDGGAGSNDEIIVNTATFAANATKLVNFETLGMGTAATGGTFDATGFVRLHSGLGITGNSAFNNIAAGTDLTVDAALAGGSLTYTLKDATSATSDAATIHIGNATTAGVAVGTIITTGVELLTIDSVGTGTGTNTVSMTNAGALSLTVTGGEAVTVTGIAGATLKTIDASAAIKLVDVSGLSVVATGVTVTGGVGGIKVVGGAGVDTITGGAGVDTINGNGGKDVIVGGGGADIITGGTGADTITLSGTTSTIVQAAGDSGANNATITQTSVLTAAFDVIKGVAAGDKIDLHFILAGAGPAFGNTTVNLAAVNLAGVAGVVEFAAGTYDGANGLFNYGAAGADTVATYDHGDGTFESIILVGYHAGATTAIAAGIVTLG